VPFDPSDSSAARPDAEALRQASLRASWARDRRVGRRRVALRWLVWAFWRYGLPLLLVLVVAASVATWIRSAAQASQRAPRFTVLPAPPAPGNTPPASTESTPARQEP
jgi:hypothetical protein